MATREIPNKIYIKLRYKLMNLAEDYANEECEQEVLYDIADDDPEFIEDYAFYGSFDALMEIGHQNYNPNDDSWEYEFGKFTKIDLKCSMYEGGEEIEIPFNQEKFLNTDYREQLEVLAEESQLFKRILDNWDIKEEMSMLNVS